jgi:hypothetical protein
MTVGPNGETPTISGAGACSPRFTQGDDQASKRDTLQLEQLLDTCDKAYAISSARCMSFGYDAPVSDSAEIRLRNIGELRRDRVRQFRRAGQTKRTASAALRRRPLLLR